jgi:hypothetical protein
LREQRFRAGANIVVEGETPRSAFVLTRGMACRFRLMPDGRRQILTILIPGDFFDLHGFLLKVMDHSVTAIGAGFISRSRSVEIAVTQPVKARKFFALNRSRRVYLASID